MAWVLTLAPIPLGVLILWIALCAATLAVLASLGLDLLFFGLLLGPLHWLLRWLAPR